MATDKDGTRIALSLLKCYEAAEMLEVWMVHDDSKDKLIKELKTAALN